MSKLTVDTVADVLKKHKIEPSMLREIVEELNERTQPEAEMDIKPPAEKKQFVILLSDPSRRLPVFDIVGWVLQIPESASPLGLQERIFNASYDFNASKKGRLHPVKSVGEALESASTKHFKAADVKVCTKLPVSVVVTDNVLPGDESHKVDKRRALA